MKRRILAVVLGIALLVSSWQVIPMAFADDEIPLPIVTDIPRVTEVPTEPPTEPSTEAPTESPTEAPTQAPTEAATEIPTQAPTESPTPIPELSITTDLEGLQTIAPSETDAVDPTATAPTTSEPTVEPSEEPGQEYLCGLEMHIHEAGCLDESSNIICGLVEHDHDETCLAAPVPDPEHYCGYDQHIHDESCLDADGNVVCGLQEHLHTMDCLIGSFTVVLSCNPSTIYTGGMTALFSYELRNGVAPYSLLLQDSVNGELLYEQALDMPEAQRAGFTYRGTVTGEHTICLTVMDSTGAVASAQQLLTVLAPESAPQWEASFADSALTGNLRSDLITIARTQLGYTESADNYILDSDGNMQGFTRYGAWYGLPYEQWSAMFVSFCLNYAGGNIPSNANCSDWVSTLTGAGIYRAAVDYAPVAGDLAFFDYNADGQADHVGILEEVIYAEGGDEIYLTTIEGNIGNQVARNNYTLPDSTVLGYAQLGKSSDKQQLIEFVRGRIDSLPTIDEFYTRLDELMDDVQQAEAYYTEVHDMAADAWVYYQCMGDAMRSFIPNGDKLMEYSFMWDANMYVLQDSTSFKVYTLNYYQNHGSGTWRPVMVYGGTVQGKIPSGASNLTGYSYWIAIVVEEGENGLYVSRIVPTGTQKHSLKANTANGFVLIIHNSDSAAYAVAQNVQIGQYVEVSFDYTTANAAYNSNGFGTVKFGLKAKPAKDNGLEGFRGEDTSDLIKIRMYNYNDTVNSRYSSTINDDVPYPGFQNPHGESSVDAVHGSSFGDNVTADTGLKSVAGTSKNGLNALADGADSPLTDKMHKTLVNGYPAMADGEDGISLKYLFDDTYRVGGDANYLFQKNQNSGQYWLNCRTNFAEFDGNNSFTLYNATLTPNLTFYPFGNFLPFNRINTEAKRVADIDREYMMSILGSAEYNAYMNVDVDQQSRLATTMRQWILEMDEEYGYDWDWADAINGYMTSTNGGKMTSFDARTNPNIKEETLYSLDYDEPTDFFFGMNIEMDFIMPKDGWTGRDNNQDGMPDYETKFSFAGDDDVWIYIDNVLFLDLSGIHRHVGGEINFVDGTVTRYSFQKSNSSAQAQYGDPMTFREILTAAGWDKAKIDAALETDADGKETFRDYSDHNFKFYYMERGSGSSICQMGFNMPVLRENAISVGKILNVDDPIPLGNPDFKFQVLKEDGSVMMEEGRAYTIYQGDPTLGDKIGTGTVGANGIFTLKAGQYAQFAGITEDQGKFYVRELMDDDVFQQYENISVSGTSYTTANGTSVQIGSDSFKGYNSPLMDISTGSITFAFTNKADAKKYGSLRISKIVDAPDELRGDAFDFQVTLGGELLPVGTAYTVLDAAGNKLRDDSVTIAGLIPLKHGETAVISNILAGTKFTVTELNTTATSLAELATETLEYAVTYSVDGGTDSTVPASGIIRDGSQAAVSVSVENKMNDWASLSIPITKSIANPDDAAHTYQFTMQQMNGSSPVGDPQIVDFSLAAGEDKITQPKAFELWYRLDEKGTYVYRITESIISEEGTTFDSSVYDVTVEVSIVNGGLAASIIRIEKDGVDITNNTTTVTDSLISFENVLADSLTIRKIVDGTAADQNQEFTFTLELRDKNNNLLSGDFSCVKVTPVADGDPITEDVTLTLDANGQASFTLKHSQALSVHGLPKGTIWKVTESESYDYKTNVTVGAITTDNTNAALGTIENGGASVVFTNTRLYVLPSTGGMGVQTLYLLGMALMLTAGISLLCMNKTKAGRKRCSGQ